MLVSVNEIATIAPTDPCRPSPCGPNSLCREINNHAVCSCKSNYIGTPPSCKPECVVSSECPQDRACVNEKCIDPCPGPCSKSARCQTVNHSPICSCAPGYSGNPFTECVRQNDEPIAPKGLPCDPSPCGPYSQCRVVGTQAACSCLPNYIGRAPNCRPECTTDSECSSNLACRNERCVDPCPGACGINAICQPVNHNPMCTCVPGYEGDGIKNCNPIEITREDKFNNKFK